MHWSVKNSMNEEEIKKLEELHHILENKTVECPSEEHIHPGPNALETCIMGHIPNPIYVPLLNVVRKKCASCRGSGKDIHCRCDYAPCLHSGLVCPACGGAGYVTRSWGDVPGALEGALGYAATLVSGEYLMVGKREEGIHWGKTSMLCTRWGDSAIDAIMEALKEQR